MYYPINPINIQNLTACQVASNARAALSTIASFFEAIEGKKPSRARLVTKSIARCFGRDKAIALWDKYLKYDYFELIDHGFYCELVVKYWRVK